MRGMETTERRPAWQQAAVLTGGFVVVLWLLEIVDAVSGHPLDAYGVQPRSDDGLVGVAAAPMLHFGFDHLVGNTRDLRDWIIGQGWPAARTHYVPNFAHDFAGVSPAA